MALCWNYVSVGCDTKPQWCIGMTPTSFYSVVPELMRDLQNRQIVRTTHASLVFPPILSDAIHRGNETLPTLRARDTVLGINGPLLYVYCGWSSLWLGSCKYVQIQIGDGIQNQWCSFPLTCAVGINIRTSQFVIMASRRHPTHPHNLADTSYLHDRMAYTLNQEQGPEEPWT